MKKYLVEFIGTLFLVFAIGMSVIRPGAGELAPFAIAATLIAMIYAGGHVSGAHFNPAVTLGVWLRGKCPTSELGPYVGAQLAGGVVAALFVKVFKTGIVSRTMLSSPLAPEVVPGLLAEFLFTFALVWVVLNVATAKGTTGNSFYGAAIGLTVLAGAFCVGPISGGVFNPAVALGACVMGLISWGSIWVYLLANCAAAWAAAAAYKFVNGKE